jgi:hypothetical protein
MWNILLSVTVAVAVAIAVAVAVAVAVAIAVAVTIAEAQTPLFSLLVSKMSILVNLSLFLIKFI